MKWLFSEIFEAFDCVWMVVRFVVWPFRALAGIVRSVVRLRALRRGDMPACSHPKSRQAERGAEKKS